MLTRENERKAAKKMMVGRKLSKQKKSHTGKQKNKN